MASRSPGRALALGLAQGQRGGGSSRAGGRSCCGAEGREGPGVREGRRLLSSWGGGCGTSSCSPPRDTPISPQPHGPRPSCNTPATGSWSLHLHDTPVPRPPVLTPQTTSAGSAQPGRAWPLPSSCSFLVPMALWGARARKGFLGRAGTGGREGAPQSGWLGRLGNDPPFCVKEAQVCGRGGGYQGARWPEHGGP